MTAQPQQRGRTDRDDVMMTHVRYCKVMTRSVVMLLSALLLPQFASSKRLAPGNVKPVVYRGIRYVAPNNDGRLGYVEVWNVGTNQKPWELTIFTNPIDPIRQRNGRQQTLRKTLSECSSRH
jgi:hypothetical protein